jgi:indolepyruvate ferredoxin oxidoreductase beta subunit
LRCRRLVKGYSDTHQRSSSKFAKVMPAARLVEGREDAGDWIARLRDDAMQDEDGSVLAGAEATIRSFI